MAKGKKQEFVAEEEIVTPEIERQAEIEVEKEKQEDTNDNVKKLMEKAKEEGGSVIVKLKKPNEVKALNIGKYKANEFDEDLIAKQFGGGIYFYVLRDEHGRIRAKWEEEYAEPLKKDNIQNSSNDIVTQVANIMKDTMKEIASIKTELSKPKDDNKESLIIDMMKQNQQQQVDLLKAIVSANKNDNQVKQPTLTEMMTMFTGMFAIVNKMNNNQPQQQQPQNTMKDVVELASLFAELKDNSNEQSQTFIDTIKTFLTDGSLANVIAMLKQPKAPMIKSPQQAPKQIEQPKPTQEQQDKAVVCQFFKQYEKELFQMKVDGNTANDVGNVIINAISLNNDFKAIAYRFFKDKDLALNNIYENSIEFKNEKEFLSQVVNNIHDYFFSSDEETQETEETEDKQNLPQGETVNEE